MDKRNTMEYWYKVAQDAIAKIVAQQEVMSTMSRFIGQLEIELIELKRKLKEAEYGI